MTELTKFPDTREKVYKERFRALDENSGKPLPNISYEIVLQDGNSVTGVTDTDGMTSHVITADPTELRILWGTDIFDENFSQSNEEEC